MTPQIPCLALGKHRAIGLSLAKTLSPHNFTLSGIVSPSPFSSHDLAVALRVPEPRPQALLIGGGYTDGEAEEAKRVFEEYMREVGIGEGEGTVVRVGPGVMDKVGVEGVGEWVVGELEKVFGK